MTNNKGKIYKKKSITVNLHPGHYEICSCGLSEKQPYCDGAHKGTEFKPKLLTIRSPKSVSLCLCKQSSSFPYCNGDHKKV